MNLLQDSGNKMNELEDLRRGLKVPFPTDLWH